MLGLACFAAICCSLRNDAFFAFRKPFKLYSLGRQYSIVARAYRQISCFSRRI